MPDWSDDFDSLTPVLGSEYHTNFGWTENGDSSVFCKYGKCPKISNTKGSDKMTYANSADPDWTASEGAVWSGSTLLAIPQSI